MHKMSTNKDLFKKSAKRLHFVNTCRYVVSKQKSKNYYRRVEVLHNVRNCLGII